MNNKRRREYDREHHYKHGTEREKMMRHNGPFDASVTLPALIERDNNICQLCGRECNSNDYEVRDGYFIAGNDYPSVDHIIPLANGGLHQWDNVQLAHRRCNSIKGAK